MANQHILLVALGAVLSYVAAVRCNPEDGVCAADGRNGVNKSAHSMLNLNARVLGKVNVHERSALQIKDDQAASTNLSDTSRVSVVIEKPRKHGHTGLPGDVVVTEVIVKCGDEVFAPSGSCPEKCPYFTSVTGDKKSCFFMCVAKEDCGTQNPSETVPDKQMGVCRACNVQGCDKCDNGPKDKCVRCATGYSLQSDGSCVSDYFVVWTWIFLVIGILMVFLVVWMVQLACAPITNKQGLEEGLEYRSGMKIHMPAEDDEADPSEDDEEQVREFYPLSTNLHVTQVAGPGTTLHMNFQLSSIMWANTLIVVWLIFVYMTDVRQLTIGLIPAETAHELCAVTMIGRTLQEEEMPLKVAWVFIVYLITFIGSIAYGIVNKRIYERISDETGMEDFAALCTGIPRIPGSDKGCEKELKECMARNTGEKVIGVSICWDFVDQADNVQDIVEKDVDSRDRREVPEPDPDAVDTRPDVSKKVFGPVDNLVGGILGLTIPDEEAEEDEEVDEEAVAAMLGSIRSTHCAFVVFETEDARDRAVERVQRSDVVPFRGADLKLEKQIYDPKVVLWENFAVSAAGMALRVTLGIVVILISLFIYAICFYAPFAYYQSMFKFPNEPGAAEGIIFSMLVVAGNQIMYQICAGISDAAGFRFRDSAESLYVALYVLAVLLSVVFDMCVEAWLGYHSMADADVQTADGRPLSQMKHMQNIFESYPMQKVLGKRLFDYCFPATFTIPFLVEPFGTVIVPFAVQKWLLRTHPEVRGRNAEKSVAFFAPMDMGRYGDILLNILLVCLILFFPSGFILPILLTYVVSAAYVYCYDQYKILRCVPAFNYGSDEVDYYSQWILVLPCSCLAACFVFKSNCIGENIDIEENGFVKESDFCVEGYTLGFRMLIAFFGHAILHLILLYVCVQWADSHHEHKQSKHTYEEAAKKEACTWFTANPIHCLRSKYIYKDTPSCCFYIQGKEHVMRKNPKIGCHFEDKRKSRQEDY